MTSQPIFHDPAGLRDRHLRRAWWGLAVVVTMLVGTLIAGLLIAPLLPRLDLRPLTGLPVAADARHPAPRLIIGKRAQRARRAQAALQRALAKARIVPGHRPSQIKITAATVKAAARQPANRPLAIGFYVNWDDSSYQSLKSHLSELDWVVPEWLRLQTGDQPFASEIDPRALDLIRRTQPGTPIIPLLRNSKDGKWEPDTLVRQIADEPSRARLVNALTQFVIAQNFQGVCIDFEEMPDSAQPHLLRFMQELRAAFKQHNWIVAQAVPFDNPDWNYRAYAAAADYLMLMAYDDHWAGGDPGDICGQNWFDEALAKRMRELDGGRTIICVGGYGYDWAQGAEGAEKTFQEAALTARDSEAQINFDPVTRNPFFRYEEEDGSQHAVWFLDGVTAYNEMKAARPYAVAGFALWRMGSEDPSLWSVFGRNEMDAAPDGLKRIRYGYDVDFEGSGEILDVAARPKDGAREIEVDAATGLISSAQYTAIPSSYVIRRAGDRPGLVALTFDDGPDEKWTPQILDILKREGVRASFFIIGENGQANPELVERLAAEGHDIGNHSFTHPNLGEVPGEITDLELNATQRLIESLTGRSTRLFRAPYFGDAEPTTPDEVEPAARAKELGYIIVGLRVDPDDWALPGADAIVRRVVDGLTNPDPDKRGQVVLLHDSGGDRSQTVAALPALIHELRQRGYRFVTVSELAGLTRDQAMPPLPADPERGWFARAGRLIIYALAVGEWALRWVFLIGIAMGLGRLVFIGALALIQWTRTRRAERISGQAPGRPGAAPPFVSVIIAAYNEEKVIAQTIGSLLASDYPAFEIIVVDDGSLDRTSAVARERFGVEPRMRLFMKPNGGKAEALNFGLKSARGEIIVALDADTIFQPETISALARHFDDPRVGAVAGNAKVGNRINVVTCWQALEYITSQNLDRRAFATLDCITVVPGAVGAWRRELLDRVGGFTPDTLAEDQDLTLRVRRLGYRIGYEERAVAWTEAPDTVRGLAKQRFRWSFGTLQCMWKHRDALFPPRYGALSLIAMPNVWVFQILFPLLSPVMDLMLLWTLVSASLERLEHPEEYAVANLGQVLFYYALFLAADSLAAAFAFLLERREQWSLLWWLFLQRFCYRQVMYYVMVKSVVTAARGVMVGWGKLERKATVAAPS
ncbi:MAG TPA: glycosyltransferase [Blastocatellia bacterium]